MMKCIWWILLGLLSVWACGFVSYAWGQDASRWHWGDARDCKSVVRIVCPEAKGAAVRGSGVIVRWRGRPVILTAAHVVRGTKEIIIHLHDRRWFRGKVTALDNTKDLAIVELGDVTGLDPVELEYQTPPAVGEELTLLGFGPDDRLAYDTGSVRKFVTMGAASAPAMDLPCHARPGDSGGPVFNAAGKVVGVVSAANNEPSAIAPLVYGWFPKGDLAKDVKQPAAEESPVLLDFYADWCEPCRDMTPEVDRIIQAGYTVKRINVDESPELASQYQVKALPSFVLLHRGREVERIVGRVPGERLRAMFGRAYTQRVYTGPIPDRVIADPGTLRKPVMVPVPTDAEPTQCGPGGCPVPQQQQRRPGLGINRDGCELNGLLPWNRQKGTPPPPPQPTGPDPAIQAQLDAIQAQLNQPPPLPLEAPPEPEPDYTGIIIGLCIAGGVVVGVILFYVVGKN